MIPRSAYIHVPFCAHRCGYCDFTLIAGRDDLIGDYLQALRLEIDRSDWNELPVSLDTLFFGGGTPTHLPGPSFQQLMGILNSRFRLNGAAEFSVEANPLDLTDAKIDLLADCGVNRISLGVQSFSPQALRLLERDHSPQDIRDVVTRLRPRFQNVSLDLIFGVPGQTLENWQETLRQAIDLEPRHISTYDLTWESGTAFNTRRERGELFAIDEELEREQYSLAMELLQGAGFIQYEISNFARPGYECRHNEAYWAGDEYFAFGPGAARYVNGRRETNIRSVLGWLNRIEKGFSSVADAEELEPEHRSRELIFLGLRRIRGIDRHEFRQKSGFDLTQIASVAIKANVDRGWLEETESGIRLTKDGRFVADRVIEDFL